MRLFAAVRGSEAAYDAVAAALAAADSPGAPVWTDRSLWHVTVVFIGNCDPGQLADRLGAVDFDPFELRFQGAGTFPERGAPPRVLWAGVGGDLDALHALHRAARDAAVRAGAGPDPRPYRPHLTLGMWRPGRPADPGCAAGLAGHTGPLFTVTELRLYASHGSWYEPLAAYQA